jgi:hypothetical protein
MQHRSKGDPTGPPFFVHAIAVQGEHDFTAETRKRGEKAMMKFGTKRKPPFTQNSLHANWCR